MAEAWVRTDEVTEFLDYCRFVDFYCQIDGWSADKVRWLVFGSVQALQATCILALSRYDTSGAIFQSRPKKLISWYNDRDGDMPEIRVASPATILKRVFDAKLLPIDDCQHTKLQRLISLRDRFMHLGASSWSLEISGLPDIFLICWRAINTYVTAGDRLHLTGEQISMGSRLVSQIMERIESKGLET